MGEADSYLPAIPLGEVMRGGAIGIVEESQNPAFAVGDYVSGFFGWQTYAISNGAAAGKLPSLPIPLTGHYGLLAHIGITAYFGVLDVGKLNKLQADMERATELIEQCVDPRLSKE